MIEEGTDGISRGEISVEGVMAGEYTFEPRCSGETHTFSDMDKIMFRRRVTVVKNRGLIFCDHNLLGDSYNEKGFWIN